MVSIASAIKKVVGKTNVLENADIKNHTTIKVSCNCRLIVFPKTERQLKKLAIIICRYNTPYIIMGAGSNLLFKNKTYNGVVVNLSQMRGKIKMHKTTIYAPCGTRVFDLLKKMLSKNLSGLEFLAGIPASVGGLVCMNAGAFGLSIKDFILKVKVLDGGKKRWLKKEDCGFCYRGSAFKNSKQIVLGAVFKLFCRPRKQSLAIIKSFLLKRSNIQPKEMSFGSVFKNPKYCSAGFLIDNLNLKGTKINGAMVSTKHANFIINTGNATGQDVYNLISFVKNKVYDSFGTKLETEVEIIGENEDDSWGLSHT